MREGAAVIHCVNHRVLATRVHFYRWYGTFSTNAPRCTRCASRFPRSSMSVGWDYYLPLLQPTLATDEEVLMIEVMCHGFASLGAPR